DRGEIDPVHLGLGREGARNVVGRNNPITDQDIDDAGSAIKFRARLSDLLARNKPDLFEHFQHIIVVSLQGELIPVMPSSVRTWLSSVNESADLLGRPFGQFRSEEHTSELQSRFDL